MPIHSVLDTHVCAQHSVKHQPPEPTPGTRTYHLGGAAGDLVVDGQRVPVRINRQRQHERELPEEEHGRAPEPVLVVHVPLVRRHRTHCRVVDDLGLGVAGDGGEDGR